MIREVKMVKKKKKELKCYLYADDMIEYLKNIRKSMKNTNTNNRHFNTVE